MKPFLARNIRFCFFTPFPLKFLAFNSHSRVLFHSRTPLSTILIESKEFLYDKIKIRNPESWLCRGLTVCFKSLRRFPQNSHEKPASKPPTFPPTSQKSNWHRVQFLISSKYMTFHTTHLLQKKKVKMWTTASIYY